MKAHVAHNGSGEIAWVAVPATDVPGEFSAEADGDGLDVSIMDIDDGGRPLEEVLSDLHVARRVDVKQRKLVPQK